MTTTICTIAIDGEDNRTTQGALLRISLDGGCPVPHCPCSDKPFIFVSDGQTGLSITLTPEDVAELRSTGTLEKTPVVQ